MFEQRLNLRLDEPNCTEILTTQRNDLHKQLIEHKQARHLTSFEPLMVCRVQVAALVNRN